MSRTVPAPADADPDAETAPPPGPGGQRWARVAWPVGVCLVVVVAAVVPLLLASPAFYMRGDTAAQFAPTWFHLGELTRAGRWPAALDPDSWVGGNYAAEALFGIYSPVNAVVFVWMSLASNLLVSMWVVKAASMAVLALGAYLLAREYAAPRWAAAAVATALPFSGFTLYWDAGSWASGLMAFAYAPWVWWAFRRTLRGALNPLLAFVVAVLGVLQGNPYGTLAVVVTGVGVLAEGALARRWGGVLRVAAVGVCVAAFLPLVYAPLLGTADLTVRSGGALFADNGKLRPELGDLLQLSSPTYVPEIHAITGPMRVPAVYFTWFLLPLLPWLRLDLLRRRGRDLAGVWVVGALYLALTVAPSKLWMFRWPLRLVEYLYLALAVLLAVLLGAGLHRSAWRARLLVTAGLVVAAAYLTWAQDPAWRSAALGGPVLLVLLTALLLAWHRWGPGGGPALAGLLVAGTVVVLAGQAVVFGENASSRVWHFPSDVATLRQRFAGYDGRVLQLADLKPVQASGNDRRLRAQWQDFLAGSMYHVADVDAVNSYSGMGFLPFTRSLCMSYDGLAKPCGYRRVWRPVAEGEPPLAELLGLDTVVAQSAMARGVRPAPGWAVRSDNGRAVVLTRNTPHPWPDSRLSWASPGVDVASAETVGPHHERVQVASSGGGRAVFALLAWPGYQATLDGRPVPVRQHPAGLLEVALPAGAHGVLDVAYRTPGQRSGLLLAAAGTAGAVALGAAVAVADRRRRPGRRQGAG